MRDREQGRARRRSGLWAYNIRILTGNTYWLVVTPVAATQLVLFWNMATATLLSATRAAETVELLAPMLGAFLCAYALAPEQDGVGELVFVRPVSLEKVVLLRMVVIFAFVLAVMTPAFVIYQVGIDGFPLGMTILAALPSMLLLSVLAMAVASATRHPVIGLGVAGGFWLLDLLVGRYFNPLLSLHGYADQVAGRPMAEQWVLGKLVLVCVAGGLYVWNRRMLGKPAAPRRRVALARSTLAVIVVLAVYVAGGAAYKVAYGMSHEGELGFRARLWYQSQFRGYGPLPVAWMFGPAFPLYIEAEVGREASIGGMGSGSLWTRVDVPRMRALVERYPASVWADNAAFEIASHWRTQPTARPRLVVSYRAGSPVPERRWVREEVRRALEEFGELADEYPESPFAPLALSQRAMIGLSVLDFGAAESAYARLVADYPEKPETYEAGRRLSALYRRGGKAEEALRAADVAARLAAWDERSEPLLSAARAAAQLGQEEVARDRYEKARAAAQEALERAIRGEKTPSRLAKRELFERSNAVISACDAGLSGSLPLPPAPVPAGAEVRGRVVKGGRGAPEVRVAIGAAAGPEGLPSPFEEGPAVSATTDGEGVFRFDSAPQGEYAVAAFALTVEEDEQLEHFVDGVRLPVAIGESPVRLPDYALRAAAAKPEPVVSPGLRTGEERPVSRMSTRRYPGGGERRGRGGGRGREGGRGRDSGRGREGGRDRDSGRGRRR